MKIKNVNASLLLIGLSVVLISGCGGGGGSEPASHHATETKFIVEGTVAGLEGELSLTLNGEETIQILDNGSYRFETQLISGNSYEVLISDHPTDQECVLTGHEGNILSSNPNVLVTCELIGSLDGTYRIGGSVSGLSDELVLTLNGDERLTLDTNTPFEFATSLTNGTPYNIAIQTQPEHQECAIRARSGTINYSNVNASILCKTIEPPVISHLSDVIISGQEVKISGSNLGVTSVSFGGEPIEPTLQLSNEIHFLAPELSKGPYQLKLENEAGTITRDLILTDAQTNFVSISSGYDYSCGLLTNGKVSCWGHNRDRYLGNGFTLAISPPGEVLGISDVVSFSVGDDYYGSIKCAVLASGTVECLGAYRGYEWEWIPISGIDNAISISVKGAQRACALLSTGSIQCMGANDAFSTLGDGNTNNGPGPVFVSGITDAVSVSVGEDLSCAVLRSGTVKCWGTFYQTINSGSFYRTPQTINGINNAVSVSLGYNYSCTLLSTGEIKCWGNNKFGQLGDGTTVDRITPVTVLGINNAVAISARSGEFDESGRVCAVLSSGQVKCWGRNLLGTLGNGTTTDSAIPVTVAGINDAVSIETGFLHTCAIRSNGQAYCWGDNKYGQLGNEVKEEINSPVTITGVSDAVSVSSSRAYDYPQNCMLLSSGIVECLGNNKFGQLGNGSTTDSKIPVRVNSLRNVTQISSAATSHCALLSSGIVKCWGAYAIGKIDGQPIIATTPVSIKGIRDAVSIYSGTYHSCALLTSGFVKCWGDNFLGQLGNGRNTYEEHPTQVEGISNAVSIGAGYGHTCSVLSTGAVQCWGSNSNGQLGDGSTNDSNRPVSVIGINNAISVTAGNYHTCALLSSGSVKCWGEYIGLGSGGGSDRYTPVSVLGISDAISLSSTAKRSCALLRDGKISCWGRISSITDVFEPVPVDGIQDAVSVDTGERQSCATLSTGAVQCWGAQMPLQNQEPSLPVIAPYLSTELHFP